VAAVEELLAVVLLEPHLMVAVQVVQMALMEHLEPLTQVAAVVVAVVQTQLLEQAALVGLAW
jgi:hypothetical protein